MESRRAGDERASLPSVDRVLRTPALADLTARYSHTAVVALVRRVLADCRARVADGVAVPSEEDVAREVIRSAESEWAAYPAPVINATGVILHTNLGRAPLSANAIAAVAAAAAEYSALEIDMESGKRSSRQAAVAALLRSLTGTEGAYVAVNNAAAVTVALASVARGKEVIVSRGQAVEIGGGFRVPVILRQSGARLVEVGTTNRTRLQDYADAITPRTAAILRVHTSNFRIVGFAEGVPLPDLARLARARDLVLIDDNGSGALLDTARYGLAHEPTPVESLAAGSHLVSFSADKLLGGPQAGIVLGEGALIDRIARHPLARAVRPDKLALSALSATLLAYLRGDAASTLPVWNMISLSGAAMHDRAVRWSARAEERGVHARLVDGESTVGGGSLPGETLPTTLIALPRGITAAALRTGTPPVLARTRAQTVLIDLRTVLPAQEGALLEAVCRVVP